MRLAAVFTLAGAELASAQVPTIPDAPTTLSPGAAGTQGPQPTPAPAGRNPGVIVVGPDGKVVSEGAPSGPGGYYIPSDGNNGGPDTVHFGPVPELHVVRSGDTLWDICYFYFNDPWQWPKIWSFNPQITNPHWIYPGDLVRLLPRGVFTTTAEPNQSRDIIAPPQRRTETSVRTTAFVEKSDLDKSITIDGAVDEKLLLGNGDQVYLTYPENKPPVVGKRYSIYVPNRGVKLGGKDVGSYVRLLGTLEVVSVKSDKRARGVIVDALQEIERGAKVGPLVTKFKNVPPVPADVDLQAPIVAMLAKDQLIGEGEVVFLGAGKGTGLKVGNRMFVVRRGDGVPGTMSGQVGQDDRRFPARALGEIVVVEVGETISIGLVTVSVQEASVGDYVMMQKAK
ncbi:MAG: LysM peptidoglycan-binding domain-containing protein [Deltaproteobacteria bacterium]|nr:LysM peptidoglycan-binding domain-containing protein [Deltaproteobacteria bacterium]